MEPEKKKSCLLSQHDEVSPTEDTAKKKKKKKRVRWAEEQNVVIEIEAYKATPTGPLQAMYEEATSKIEGFLEGFNSCWVEPPPLATTISVPPRVSSHVDELRNDNANAPPASHPNGYNSIPSEDGVNIVRDQFPSSSPKISASSHDPFRNEAPRHNLRPAYGNTRYQQPPPPPPPLRQQRPHYGERSFSNPPYHQGNRYPSYQQKPLPPQPPPPHRGCYQDYSQPYQRQHHQQQQRSYYHKYQQQQQQPQHYQQQKRQYDYRNN